MMKLQSDYILQQQHAAEWSRIITQRARLLGATVTQDEIIFPGGEEVQQDMARKLFSNEPITRIKQRRTRGNR